MDTESDATAQMTNSTDGFDPTGSRDPLASGRKLNDIGIDQPPFNTPSNTDPEGFQKPKKSVTIDDCDCGVPDLEVAKGNVGEWRVQIVSCGECGHRFGAAMERIEEEDDDA